MFGIEKIARGIIPEPKQTEGGNSKIEQQIKRRIMEEEIKNREQYQYNFADARKYVVKIEIDKDRAKGPIYRSRKR